MCFHIPSASQGSASQGAPATPVSPCCPQTRLFWRWQAWSTAAHRGWVLWGMATAHTTCAPSMLYVSQPSAGGGRSVAGCRVVCGHCESPQVKQARPGPMARGGGQLRHQLCSVSAVRAGRWQLLPAISGKDGGVGVSSSHWLLPGVPTEPPTCRPPPHGSSGKRCCSPGCTVAAAPQCVWLWLCAAHDSARCCQREGTSARTPACTQRHEAVWMGGFGLHWLLERGPALITPC